MSTDEILEMVSKRNGRPYGKRESQIRDDPTTPSDFIMLMYVFAW